MLYGIKMFQGNESRIPLTDHQGQFEEEEITQQQL